MAESAYERLGVTSGATDEMIRTAYRRMAKKFHPDKGGKEEDFLKIQEAYQVLSTPELRQVYDRSGWKGVEMAKNGGGGMDGEMPEFFSQFFGGGGGVPMGNGGFSFFQMNHPRQRQERNGASDVQKRIPDRVIPLVVDLAEAYQGRTIHYRLKRKKYKGEKFTPTKCGTCGGMGKVGTRPANIPSFLMVPPTVTVCPKCAGLGVSVSEKDMESVTETLTLQVPKYCPEGYTITVSKKTDELPGMETGDVVFTVRYKEDFESEFRVEDHHIITTLTIDLQEAVGGFTRDVVFLDGKSYRVILPPYTSLFQEKLPGMTLHDVIRVVEAQGFYTDQEMLHRGNWILQFNLRFPVNDSHTFWDWRPKEPTDIEQDDKCIILLNELPTLQNMQQQHHREPHSSKHVHQQECRQS